MKPMKFDCTGVLVHGHATGTTNDWRYPPYKKNDGLIGFKWNLSGTMMVYNQLLAIIGSNVGITMS